MKSIFIGDVHHKIEIAERICQLEQDADEIVFIGDYLDDYGDSSIKTKKTCDWLIKSLKRPNRVHLIGNHDLHYFCLHEEIQGSGFGVDKWKRFCDHEVSKKRDRFKFFHISQGFLCSHAGIHPSLVHPIEGCAPDWLKEQEENIWIYLDSRRVHPLVAVGRGRGGYSAHGGITWQDWNEEFECVSGMNQIVGHTRSRDNDVRIKNGENSINYCIDTELKKYLEVIDGKVNIKNI